MHADAATEMESRSHGYPTDSGEMAYLTMSFDGPSLESGLPLTRGMKTKVLMSAETIVRKPD